MWEETDVPTPSGVATTVFRPVRSGNAFEEAVERILQAIKLGLITYGERLPPERELATRLGVGRSTIREALGVLQESGFVEARRGRFGGTFVTFRPSAEPSVGAQPHRIRAATSGELEDVLTLRSVLEVGTAAAAASRALDEEARQYLRSRLGEADRASFAEYRQLDSRLHLAVAEMTGSPSLASSLADARMRLNDLLDAFPLLPRNIEHSRAQHRAICEAILAGNPESARAAAEEHVDATAALVRGFLAYEK